ncbi:glycosyltransferase [Streptosporangium sp. CA-115845]|uniref:glycosyltransferase n=1 Tax=Streptosporangium sp. CA-115845 TaxID=3240071 RepID=UPI003D94B982
MPAPSRPSAEPTPEARTSLLTTPGLLAAYGTAAAVRARSDYDWNKIADRTAAVYAGVISSRVPAWRKDGARSYPGVA